MKLRWFGHAVTSEGNAGEIATALEVHNQGGHEREKHTTRSDAGLWRRLVRHIDSTRRGIR